MNVSDIIKRIKEQQKTERPSLHTSFPLESPPNSVPSFQQPNGSSPQGFTMDNDGMLVTPDGRINRVSPSFLS